MKIKHLKIENFRAFKNFNESIGSYTSFIGYNGGGKSSILHALRWFFEDFELKVTDVFSESFHEQDVATLPEVKVSVTFDDLTDLDRVNFGPYALGETMTLSRVGQVNAGSKLYGKRLVCSKFSDIRNENKVADKRKNAVNLINEDDRFKDLGIDLRTSKDEIEEKLQAWELDPKNIDSLEPIDDIAANNFFGAVGSNKLKIHSGFVFIPAAPDLTSEFDFSGKGSALQLLLGDILKGVVGKSISEWTEKNKKVLDELESSVKESASAQLGHRAKQVNYHLQNYLPGVEIEFGVGLEDWAPRASPSTQSLMRRDNRDLFIESEGHGVQRATLLALLQATADARVEVQPSEEQQDGATVQKTTLIVCVEEPEVYQHPVQARMMARSFVKAADDGNVQFILATHSPYFLSPNHLENTFRVAGSSTGSSVSRPSPGGVLAEKHNNGELDKYFLETVVECLFSRAALVVEGDTERAVFDTIQCGDDGWTLRDAGVSIAIAGGAATLLTMAELIRSFGVPTFVVRDGDSDQEVAFEAAIRKSKNDIWKDFECSPDPGNPDHLEIIESKKVSILASWKHEVETFIKNAQKNGLGGGLNEFSWGKGHVVGKYAAILEHDLETELHRWNSFTEEAVGLGLPENLRKAKKAGVFARAASLSNTEDMPVIFKNILLAVRDLADS